VNIIFCPFDFWQGRSRGLACPLWFGARSTIVELFMRAIPSPLFGALSKNSVVPPPRSQLHEFPREYCQIKEEIVI
jgi:hypothetical protein